ncbi:diguanylate cyclase (GGDEF) domain-containing protein [Hoeflea sp. IMCC20628]|uniref:sensor domain-containing phosphodiesterase n=1 Tax=Hoeflea sp. IMCC20628 TaxID=1620421 RepID=UPI00063AF1FC|nr:EAL domain-containing protein [Hoeflea sp. IMCC20628]AKI00706.1 diguanylate cyclase (GGDEF) domain-containing protein [Hoeflea sp. IMCC20628]
MLVGLQNTILKMVAQGDELGMMLTRLCREVELLLPGCYASILTLDDNGLLHPCAAPSLPEQYSAALDNLSIGPSVGSCGTAAFLQDSVDVTDIENDPRWASYKDLALSFGLPACCSSPIFGSKGTVLGTLALYFREPRGPTQLEQNIVVGCLPLCMIALECHERLQEHRRLAFTDAMTGLPNRGKFGETVKTYGPTDDWSLLLVDVDNLKSVNDTFGHAAGDDLISTVASRLQSAVAPSLAYRLGGDEFAVLLDKHDRTQIEKIVKQIVARTGQPAVCGGHTILPTATIGIARSDQVCSVADIHHHADIALYNAKEVNRGSFAFYDAGIASAISRRSEAIKNVALALKEDRIEAWYQPIVRIDTGEVVGVEALARMRLSDGTIVPAAQFHEATKDAQVAANLTRNMIKCISSDVGNWLRLGIPFQHVGINLSAADFRGTDLQEIFETAFALENVPLHHVILEVTESVYLGGRDHRVADEIGELRNAGFKVALDDFGTGFASLTHLITVPVDIIKIDKSFVDRLGPEDVGTGIVEGILHIAKRLGIRVIAEGIETLAQADLLVERGCVLGQGYLYSKALPVNEMTILLQRRGQKQDSASKGKRHA